MTTRLAEPPVSPPRKPPILTPKPVLATPAEGEEPQVENDDFHRKLERFKHLTKGTTEDGGSRDQKGDVFQTQTIRRRSKTKSRENRHCERLNVSPVRRRQSQASPERRSQNGVKKRSESDSVCRSSVAPEVSDRRQLIDNAIESLTQELADHGKQNSLRRKPVPPPKKVALASSGGPPTATVLSAKGVDPGLRSNNNNVQSTPSHSENVSRVMAVVKEQTGGKQNSESTAPQTSNSNRANGNTARPYSNKDKVELRTKKVPKPSPKPAQRKTIGPVPETDSSSTLRNGGRDNIKSELRVLPRDDFIDQIREEDHTRGSSEVPLSPKGGQGMGKNVNRLTQNVERTRKVKVLPKPKAQKVNVNNVNVNSTPSHPDSVDKTARKEHNVSSTPQVTALVGTGRLPERTKEGLAQREQSRISQVSEISTQEITEEVEFIVPSHHLTQGQGAALTDTQGVQIRPKPAPRLGGDDETSPRRISVLDMVGSFESKRATKTLGRISKKNRKKLVGLSSRNISDATDFDRAGPGLSRRLSRSLGNINEVSHSDDWEQKWRVGVRVRPKPKSKTPDFESDCRKKEITSEVAKLGNVVLEERVDEPKTSSALPEEKPDKPYRNFVPGTYDTPGPPVDAGVPRKKQALRPPTVVSDTHKAFQPLTDVPHSYQVLPEPSASFVQETYDTPGPPVNVGVPRKQPLRPPSVVSEAHEAFQPPSDASHSHGAHQEPSALFVQEAYDTPRPAVNGATTNEGAPRKQALRPPSVISQTHGTFQPTTNVSQPIPPQPPHQTPSQTPPTEEKAKVTLRDKSRRTLPRSHRINRKASVDRPVYAPPGPPPQPGEAMQYKIPLNNNPHNRNSVIELPSSRPPLRKHSRPKSESSFIGGSIYATPGIDIDPTSKHPYHVLENHDSMPIDNTPIFGQRIPSNTLEDEGGYAIPGSHLWGVQSVPGLSSFTALPPTERPRAASADSRPRSNNNAVPPGVHGYTEPTQPEAPVVLKERHFKPLRGGRRYPSNTIKMRRKIHEAFKSKTRTEEDTASVTSEDSEVDDAITEQRLSAVRRMKARTSHYCSLEQARRLGQFDKLYEYVVVVSLKYDKEQRRYEPCEIKRFPEEVSDTQNDKLRAIPHFCFPDSFKWAPVESYNSETFSFVLTSFDGSRFYGYNRRLLPPGEGARLPEVFCVMSPFACYPVYYQLLDEIEKRRKHSMEDVVALLEAAYDTQLPRPGGNVRVSANLMSLKELSFKEPLFLQRPQDSRLEQIDFDYLFKCISIPHVLQIFGSLLLERRIVMFSSYLSKLSKCSQAIAALLYPFAWQHVYVPVLPMKLLDMCCSPTPYIMGMLSLSIPELEGLPLDEVLIVNLDAGEFDVHVGDEGTILPKRLFQGLEKALKTCLKENDAIESRKVEDELSEDCETRNKSISEAFILYFVELMGHYLHFFPETVTGSRIFDRDGFLKGTTSKSCKRFLEVFTETQMFSLFIQEKEADSEEGLVQTLFDQRIQSYESERRNSKLLGVNVKKLGQKITSTAKGVKGKVLQEKI